MVELVGPGVVVGGVVAVGGEVLAEVGVVQGAGDGVGECAGVRSAGMRQLCSWRQKSRLPWASVQTTAAPAAIASSTGRQKPSCFEVCSGIVAWLRSSLTCSSLGRWM